MFGPFWFNPVTFEWNKLQEDYSQWLRWMEETGGSAEASWAVWWREENSFYKDLSVSWKSCLFIQKFCIWLVIAVGMFQRRFFRDQDEQKRVLELLLVASFYGLGHWCISKLERSLSYAIRRFSSLVLTTSVVLTLLYFYISHGLYVRYSIALYYFFSALCSLLLLAGFPSINQVYKYHDYLVGHTIFAVLAILSTLQIGYLQTWLLYHNALSAGVAIEDILKHARKTRERGIVEDEDISTLRAQLQEQERLVKQLYETLGKSGGASVGLNGGIGGSIGVPSSSSSSSSTAGVYNSNAVTETTGLLSSANNNTNNSHNHHPQVSFAIPSQKSPALPPTAPKSSVGALSSSLSKGYGSTAATDSTFIHVSTSVPFSAGNTPASVPVSVLVSSTSSEMKKVSDLFLI